MQLFESGHWCSPWQQGHIVVFHDHVLSKAKKSYAGIPVLLGVWLVQSWSFPYEVSEENEINIFIRTNFSKVMNTPLWAPNNNFCFIAASKSNNN
jgi:hypothetical protein